MHCLTAIKLLSRKKKYVVKFSLFQENNAGRVEVETSSSHLFVIKRFSYYV